MELVDNIDGLNVNYSISGKGESVVLLHGWGCDLNIFEKVQLNLEKYFTVYAIDFPGFGKSDAPNEVWGVQQYTSFIEKFFNKKDIKNPILIGHSFGGRVSILYASRNRTKKIILVDSAGIKPKRKLNYYIKVYSYKSIKNILRVFMRKTNAESFLEKYRNKSGSSDYQSVSGIMRKILVKVVNEDLSNVLQKINAPTLLIWGENDTATPVEDAKKMEKLIPDAGLVVLKNAGHYSFIDKFNDFLIIINNFLKPEKNN